MAEVVTEVTEEFGFVGGFLQPWQGNRNPADAEYQRKFSDTVRTRLLTG